MQFVKTKLSLLLLLLLPVFAFAQKGAIRGFVYDADNGEPVIFTNVYLDGTTIGASTDVNGYYSITKLEPGTYKLTVSAIGFEKFQESIVVEKDDIVNKNITIKPAAVEMDEFVVSAAKKEAKTQVNMSVVKLTPKEIKTMPSIGGQPDLAQYIQVLPGVVFTGDQGGQLYIRGGSPIQNMVLLDGMPVYSPFHSIGLFSVFDTDALRNADVYTGGFNAEYGGRISSVMDITMKDGNKSELSGKVGANPFGAKVLLEGPLWKKKDGSRGASFIVSAKTSYLDKTSKALYSYVNKDGLPFKYTDLYGKLSFGSNSGSKFNLFGFNFTDEVDYQFTSKLNWNNFGLGANFVLVPAKSPVLVEGLIAYSKYDITLEEADLSTRSSGINGFDLGLNFKYFSGKNEIKYGVQITGLNTTYNVNSVLGNPISNNDNSTQLSGFFLYKIIAGKLVIEPSVRAQYYASLSELSLEPRLGAKYNVSDKLRLKGAVGKYSQNLIAGNSDRDVVNLFYGYISTPQGVAKSFVNEEGETIQTKNDLQLANHAIFGFEFDLTNRISMNVEAYYKRFSQLANINRNKIFADTPENADRPDQFKKDYVIETGNAKGIDFVLKYTTKKFYLWTVYSLGKVDRWDGLITYAPIFDRRHNVNVVSTYKFGKNDSWEASVRWNLGSGLPFTQTQGFYEQVTINGLESDPSTSNGELGVLYGELNGGRLPYYHRLDLSISKKIKFEKSELDLNLGVTNAYDRRNIFYYDRIKNERVDQLPILPNFGVNYRF